MNKAVMSDLLLYFMRIDSFSHFLFEVVLSMKVKLKK